MKKIILTIGLLFLITSAKAEKFTYIVPASTSGGMAKWAITFVKEWSKEMSKEGHSIVLRYIKAQKGKKGFTTWYKDHSDDNTVIIQTKGYINYLMTGGWKGFDPRIHGQTLGGQLQGTFVFKKTDVEPGKDNVAIIFSNNTFVDAMGHMLMMCGNKTIEETVKCGKTNTRWVSGFKGMGEARQAFLVNQLQVMRDGFSHARKTYKKQIKSSVAQIWYSHGTVSPQGDLIPDPNVSDKLFFANKFKAKYGEPATGEFYDVYAFLLKLRAAIGKTIFTKKDNPHYDMLVRTMQSTIQNKKSKKKLDKKLGIYPWHFGDDSQVIVSSVWGKLDKKVYDDMFTVLRSFNEKMKKRSDLF